MTLRQKESEQVQYRDLKMLIYGYYYHIYTLLNYLLQNSLRQTYCSEPAQNRLLPSFLVSALGLQHLDFPNSHLLPTNQPVQVYHQLMYRLILLFQLYVFIRLKHSIIAADKPVKVIGKIFSLYNLNSHHSWVIIYSS